MFEYENNHQFIFSQHTLCFQICTTASLPLVLLSKLYDKQSFIGRTIYFFATKFTWTSHEKMTITVSHLKNQ